MDLFSRRLSHELKLWVDQGVCPPEVMEQIEKRLRQQRRRAFWRARSGHLVMAAAAAVFLIALAGARLDLAPEHLASLPLVGSLAAQFLSGEDDDLQGLGAKAVPVNLAAERDGVDLVVSRVLTTRDSTRVQYTLPAGTEAGQPELRGPEGPVWLHRVSSRTSHGRLVVTAEFDPVPAGEEVTLTVQGISVTFRTE